MKRGKLLAFLLSFVLVLILVPCYSFAEGDDVVAKIGEKEYSSLQTAFNEAPNGVKTTIVLEKDIKVNNTIVLSELKDVIFDMNGKKITVTSDFAGRPITNNGTMLIEGNGTIDSSMSDLGGYGAVDNYGTLIINNGIFTGSVNASGASIKNRPDCTVTINGGEFNGAVTALYNEGKAYIYDGKFDCRSCSSCNSDSWGYTIQSHQNSDGGSPELYFYNGTVIGVQGAFSTSAGYSEIWDGSFTTVPCKNHLAGNTAFYALYIAGESGEVESNIYGGTFESATRVAAFIGNSNDGGQKKEAIANFYGGTFIAGEGATETIHVDDALGGLEITGGTYMLSDKTRYNVSEYFPEDSEYSQNEDGSVMHNHKSAAVHYKRNEPTCTSDGNTEYWYCKICDKYFSDENCSNEIVREETVIAKLAHNYENGKCTVCGAADPDYKPDSSAQTGDDFNMAIPFAAAGIALAAMAAVVATRKRHN